MAEQKYKVNTKSKLTKVAEDLKKVLNVRGSTPAAPPAGGEESAKKPSGGESSS